MSLRSAALFSVALLMPIGAHAQADQESVNMCIQQVCSAAESAPVVLADEYGLCMSQAGNPNCDAAMAEAEAAAQQCVADCTNDPDAMMGN